MRITNVVVYPTVQGTLRGYADVTFDNSLCVRDFRLLHTPRGMCFVCLRLNTTGKMTLFK